MKDRYVDECKQIQQNCTYTAEAHHLIAGWHRALAIVFQVIPAGIAAVTAALVAANMQPDSFLWATVISSVISAVATVLDPSKQAQAHLSAAKSFTTLKHDARFLHDAKSSRLSEDAFIVAVENLHEKYNDLVKASPATGKIAFEIARTFVRRHEPDRNNDGSIK